MRTRRVMTMNERGSSTTGAVIAIVILGAMVYAALQIVPILWAHWNFEDDIKTKLQFAFLNYKKDVKEQLTTDIKRSLDEMGANYKDKDIKVKVTKESKKIVVEVWYSRSHKLPSLPFFQNPKPFYIRLENTPI